jgi:hypothetical protein
LFLSINTWPSFVYILGILAWDWFYGLSMLFRALVFKGGRVETAARLAMAVSGVLSIAGMTMQLYERRTGMSERHVIRHTFGSGMVGALVGIVLLFRGALQIAAPQR